MANDKLATQASNSKNALLKAFIGKWHTTGEVVASPSTPAAKVDAIDTYEWLPGNYAIIHYADSAIGDDKFHAIEIIGYDTDRQAFFAPFFDDQGGVGWEEARADGRTWIFRGENVMGAKHHRCIAVFSEDGNTLEARHEQSSDGENWQPWMNVTLTK